jgi:hypothetical protein
MVVVFCSIRSVKNFTVINKTESILSPANGKNIRRENCMSNVLISEDEINALDARYGGRIMYAEDDSGIDLGGEISQRIREAEIDDTHPKTDSGMDF